MKVDAQTEDECEQTGYSLSARVFLPKALLQETESSIRRAIRNLRRIQFAIQEEQLYATAAGQHYRTSIYQTYFVFVPLFSKPIYS